MIIEWLESAAKEHDKEIKIKNIRDSIHVTTSGRITNECLSMSANLINHLFQTQMHSFINSKNNGVAFKHLGPLIVPNHIAPHIDVGFCHHTCNRFSSSPESLNFLLLLFAITNHIPILVQILLLTISATFLTQSNNFTIFQKMSCPIQTQISPSMAVWKVAASSKFLEYIVNPNNPSGFSAPSLEQFQKANDLPDV